MDQTINEMEKAYIASIERTYATLTEQSKKGFKASGIIIGKDDTLFYKKDGKLHQVVPAKLNKFIRTKCEELGVNKSFAETGVAESLNDAEMVGELV